MVKQKEIDLAELVSRAEVDLYKRRNKGYSLLALERGIYLPSPAELGHYLYKKSPTIRNKFDRLLRDEDFSGLNYTDVTSGPFSNASYWAKEVANELRKREPENLVFYLRRDPKLISARILI